MATEEDRMISDVNREVVLCVTPILTLKSEYSPILSNSLERMGVLTFSLGSSEYSREYS